MFVWYHSKMKKLLIALLAIAVLAGVLLMVRRGYKTDSSDITTQIDESDAITVVARGFEIPWDIAFFATPASQRGGLAGGEFLVTERPGRLVHIQASGIKRTISIPGAVQKGEGGLLGIALHPNFTTNHWLYLYMSSAGSAGSPQAGTDGQTKNRVVRYTYENNALTREMVLIDNIPGAVYHDGGRMAFGPDGLLYITTGDATEPKNAQDKTSLAGKILRIHEDGKVPAANPFGTAVYSYGHRNPQGLAWDSSGQLWETEHGRSGVTSGLDEINLIESGKNYGWPDSEGDTVQSGTVGPVRHSGATTTWAPASAAIIGNRLFFGGLLGEALYEAELSGKTITSLKTHFKGELGRIRTVKVGPDGMLYLTTSNRDGRGSPQDGDDKVIRVNPAGLK